MKKIKLFLYPLFLITQLFLYRYDANIMNEEMHTDVIGIEPYANHTEYVYRVKDGKLYKRLWSYTYSRWEDPYWTLV